MAGRKKKVGPFDGVPAVSWDTPANAVTPAALRAANAVIAGVPPNLHPAFAAMLNGMEGLNTYLNDDKALGESQAKFEARLCAYPRKKAGPRQRRAGR